MNLPKEIEELNKAPTNRAPVSKREKVAELETSGPKIRFLTAETQSAPRLIFVSASSASPR
jgi:hypothetical protein